MKKNNELDKIRKTIGLGFKNARNSLGFTMDDLVGNLRSKGSMSEFENGKGDLPVVLFYFLIEKMRLTFNEFEFLSNNYELSGFRKTWFEVMKYCAENDRKSVDLSMKKASWSTNEGIYDPLDYLMLKQIVSYTYDSYTLNSAEKKKIISHLKSTNDWKNRDLVLYANTVTAFEPKVVKELSDVIIVRTAFYNTVPENKKLIAQILINTIWVLLDGKEISTAIRVKNQINDLLSDTDAHERISFLFTCGMIEYYRGEQDLGKERMQDAIEIFRKIGSYESAKRCQTNYDEVINRN